MSFLVLAQGDPIGRDLLKKLVVARYGPRVPAMHTLRVMYEGRSRAKLGPIRMWARLQATATYRFPDRMRWDFKIRMLYIFRTSFTTSFDGQSIYEQKGLRVTEITDENETKSARMRAWMETVYFVSPLIANDQVRVEGCEASCFRALLPNHAENAVMVRLHDDHTLCEITAPRWDPDLRVERQHYIRPSGELTQVDGLIMPQKLQRFWDDELFMELTPVGVELNPELTDADFVLEDEDISDILGEVADE